MPVPQVTERDVASILPALRNVAFLARGGQKIVFSCEIEGSPYVLKFLLVEAHTPDNVDETTMPALDAVTARAQREVDTMASINIPTLVRLGPIGLNMAQIRGQSLLYFTEEKIEGGTLRQLLDEHAVLPISDLIGLGCDITAAIESIWQLRRIHRDVKPSNVMRRAADGRFVFLDVGLVFDLEDVSLTLPYLVVGTKAYLSPDQMEYTRKRRLDFRSDLFALGVVLYESATGQHPFAVGCSSTTELVARILNDDPPRLSQFRPEIPSELEEVVLRLLQKSPHLRYRSCQQLVHHLRKVPAQ